MAVNHIDEGRRFDGELQGATVRSVLLGLKASPQLATKLLRSVGIGELDDAAWYDLNTVRALHRSILVEIGPLALNSVGLQMIEAAGPPPGVHDIPSMLEAMDAGYKLYARGKDLGGITCTFPQGREGRSATLVFAIPFSCVLNKGIVQGCCKKFGARALVEHGSGGCVDKGGTSCTYHVSW